MQSALPLGSVLKAALLAAIFAAMVTAGFHSFATEPVIERAIALEEAHAHAMGEAEEPPVVSREVQRGGLILGYGLYGLAWGLMFGVAYMAARRFLPAAEGRRALWVAAIAYVCVGLLPMLKYPANPPGVGDPGTIEYRQGLYLALLGLGVLAGAVSIAVARMRQQNAMQSLVASAAVLLVAAGLLLALLPGNPDEVTVPLDLLSQFRLFSVVGVTLFWGVFAVGFAWLISRAVQPVRSARAS